MRPWAPTFPLVALRNNKSGLIPRVLTALVGIPVLVIAIWWGPPWLTLLVLAVAVLGVREFYRLAPLEDSPTTPSYPVGESRDGRYGVRSRLPLTVGALWAIALILGGQAASSPGSLWLISLGVSAGGAFVALLWLVGFYNPPTLPLKRGGDSLVAGAYLLGGPIYIGFPLGHALLFRDLGPDWLLFALLVTFATDTGAFFTGRSIGRHQMAPTISPSKTWEGAAGGFALATVVALILGLVGEYGHTPLQLALSLWQEAIIGATVGVVSQLGDLFESKLKRLSHAKDAGSIIPGHGGILDRLDSIVTSVPVVYYLVAVVFKP